MKLVTDTINIYYIKENKASVSHRLTLIIFPSNYGTSVYKYMHTYKDFHEYLF